ncbi:MAG: ATP-dependent DNA helicase RecG, partial [Deltaproteobacteria bacterium]|nr:ATP-dependent DNA helicase RecG [Deltaproteobacteria bacterium]
MDTFKKILQKIEQPLNFAFQEDYKNITHIKNIGKTLVNLLLSLKGLLPRAADNSVFVMIDELLNIFSDYDEQKLEAKKIALGKAKPVWVKLKAEVNFLHQHNKQEENTAESVANLRESSTKLCTPIQYLKGVGPKMAARFAAKKINTVEDLLFFLPRTYEDRREIRKINRLEMGKIQTAVGNVISCRYRYYGKRRILEAVISDETANLTAKWFKGRITYLLGVFKKDIKVIFTGEVRPDYHGKLMIHPDYEILDETDNDNLLNFKRIVPIYSETEGLHQKYIRKIMHSALEQYSRYVASPIPSHICEKRNLINIHEALREVHFPNNNESMEQLFDARSAAHRRLIYDEFFFFQLGMALKKSGRILEKGIAFNTAGNLMNKFYALLPFSLTGAQKRVVGEILSDMESNNSMNRLLQGDVGSGKTIVSMAAMIRACENNYQVALMAPTEILAKQHFDNIKSWADELGLKVVLLTGSMGTAARGDVLEQIKNGQTNIIIGTHALIQEGVDFHKLGLVITDEQHRFGVMQRATLRNKGINADVLVMTATPIPRTLAMTVYGDLDVSVIDEMPPGK